MSGTVAELRSLYNSLSDDQAKAIAALWDKWNMQRQGKINEWTELRNFIFATDTTTTSNSGLPWKNKTTLPKLCQIRDNLHANYISSLFPNSNWMKWEGATVDDEVREKAQAITGYMQTKTRESHFKDVGSKLVYDFIDYGNAFAEVEYASEYHIDEETGIATPIYVGPRARRISPLDIVFNPTAPTFEESPKIVRRILHIGEVVRMAEGINGEAWQAALDKSLLMRESGSYSYEDFQKAIGISIDGFGNLQEYYQSDYVEVLEFRGDYYDKATRKLHRNQQIIVIDRSITVMSCNIPNWLGKSSIVHVAWRYRPDNLWGMGPLDNLVGMQYRIDHLENLKADAMDLAVHPPLKIKGDVDPFDWGPGSEIPIIGDGDVEELGKNLSGVLAAENAIAVLEQKMEEFAGAPKQAMGIRTPGEKTAYEVQQLENAAGRIFQEKVTLFETELLEPLLNLMLECARRNLDSADVVRTMDDDFGVETFLTVDKTDITARGKLRPIGARHFGEQAQLLQNMSNTLNTPLGQVAMPHLSPKGIANMLNDVLQLYKWNIYRPNVGLVEQAETQQFAGDLEQVAMERQATPV